jgi:hypothetical protein
MNSQATRRFVAACACAALVPAWAGTGWDESVSGDLSNNGLAPTPVAVALGSNVVTGFTGDAGAGIDRDYFSFTVPEGLTLTALTLLPVTSVSGGASFIAIQAGPQLTVTPTGGGVENLLGFAHYGTDLIGLDLLPVMAVKFTGALPSGTYSVWVQELGGTVPYGFDFVISSVPELPPAALLAAGLGGLVLRRRFR